MSFADLPRDIHLSISRFLGPRSLLSLCCTCKTLQKMYSLNAIWSGKVHYHVSHDSMNSRRVPLKQRVIDHFRPLESIEQSKVSWLDVIPGIDSLVAPLADFVFP